MHVLVIKTHFVSLVLEIDRYSRTHTISFWVKVTKKFENQCSRLCLCPLGFLRPHCAVGYTSRPIAHTYRPCLRDAYQLFSLLLQAGDHPTQALALVVRLASFSYFSRSTFSVYLIWIELRTITFCLHIEPSGPVASVLLTALHLCSFLGHRIIYLVLNSSMFIFCICFLFVLSREVVMIGSLMSHLD